MAQVTLTELNKVAAAARVLTEHYPSRTDRATCYCGKEWHPRHQAEALDQAGLLAKD